MMRRGWIAWVTFLTLPLCAHSADFSAVPISGKRAYGRVRDTSMIIQSASLKRLNVIESKDSQGNVNGRAQVYGLSLLARDGTGFVLYFTTPTDSSLMNLNYRRRPNLAGTPEYRANLLMNAYRIPMGLTSSQLLFRVPEKSIVQSKVFRNLFSARLVLGLRNGNEIPGQIILVTPDLRKSFIVGAFKAQLVGF
jgi:hypothetical protein